jgi:hypothetical protein
MPKIQVMPADGSEPIELEYEHVMVVNGGGVMHQYYPPERENNWYEIYLDQTMLHPVSI